MIAANYLPYGIYAKILNLKTIITMKTIDFDIEKAKSGEYEIVTKHGVPVRIICWDKQDGVFKLVGLVKDTDGYEYCQSYDEHGDAREGDTAFNLQLVTDNMPYIDGFTDFEYAVGKEMYGYRYFKKAVEDGDQSVIDDVKRAPTDTRLPLTLNLLISSMP